MSQDANIKFNPFIGGDMVTDVSAEWVRKNFPSSTWRYNPWTGQERRDHDINRDPCGEFLTPPPKFGYNVQVLPKIGIGDVTSDAKGSGARFNTGKPDFSLLPLCTLEDEIRVWEYGKKKYAAFNWAKGMPWSVPFSCAMRHMAAWQRGEENDAESGLPHLAHAMCNLRMLTLFAKTYKEGDDRPPAALLTAQLSRVEQLYGKAKP